MRMRGNVVVLAVMLGCRAVRLRRVFVMLSGFRVGFFRHGWILLWPPPEMRSGGRGLAVPAAFGRDFLGRVERRSVVEGGPAALPVRCLARDRVHGLEPGENVARLQHVIALDASGHEGAA